MRRHALIVGGVALITVIAGVAVAASASAGTETYEAEAGVNTGCSTFSPSCSSRVSSTSKPDLQHLSLRRQMRTDRINQVLRKRSGQL